MLVRRKELLVALFCGCVSFGVCTSDVEAARLDDVQNIGVLEDSYLSGNASKLREKVHHHERNKRNPSHSDHCPPPPLFSHNEHRPLFPSPPHRYNDPPPAPRRYPPPPPPEHHRPR